MSVIGVQDQVYTTDKLTVTFSYGSFLPELFLTETVVREALQSLGHNVVAIDVDTLAGFRKIVASFYPAYSAQAGIIGKQAADTIREYSWVVWSVSAEKYEIGSTEPVVGVPTAISLASVAVIALVAFGAVIYLRSVGGLK